MMEQAHNWARAPVLARRDRPVGHEHLRPCWCTGGIAKDKALPCKIRSLVAEDESIDGTDGVGKVVACGRSSGATAAEV